MGPRVRFAPSPTGYLHVGGARTALFNWLYARHTGGTFVLRIEDTDVERSSADMVTGILEGLRWLGLTWDEGPEVGGPHAPYFQSARLDRYRDAANSLVAEGHVYFCYCSTERLRQERERAEGRGEAWRYDRACLALSPERIAEFEATTVPRVVRFKVPAGPTSFDDAVRGRIEFDGANIEDFVILRSDNHPTYHLSVVVDDVDMGITDVIRGDDHISNTPKHVLLFQAIGVETPRFAHVPLIVGTDKKRLSKRHGATSLDEYRRQGYLPTAMVNFLALLGWAPGGDRELMAIDELTSAFSLEQISGGNAVFDTEKLDWMSGQYIARMPVEELAAAVAPFLAESDDRKQEHVEADLQVGRTSDVAWWHRVLELLRPRAKRLADFVELARPFLVDVVKYEQAAIDKHLGVPELSAHVATLIDALERVSPFEEEPLETTLRAVATDRGIKSGSLIHATRVAATGRTTSAGLFEVLVLLGRERTIERLRWLQEFLEARA